MTKHNRTKIITSTDPAAEVKANTKSSKFELILSDIISDEYITIIGELEQMYPETVMEFKKCMLEEFVTFCKKQYDYGPGNISVGTQLKDEKEILISLKGIWFRTNDKIQRLFNMILVRDSLETTNESVDDAWMDLSVYGKIARIVMTGKWAK